MSSTVDTAEAGDGREIPRYMELVNTLLDEIRGGLYATGQRLPTEHELCDRFAVSRYTVREALRRLQEMGFVERRQGMGTVLISDQGSGQFVNSISRLDELLQYASSTRLEILSIDRIVLQAEQARRLRCDTGTQWYRISALRRAEAANEPVGYSEIYVDPEFEEVLGRVGVERKAVYAMIEQHYGVRIREVQQDIEAAAADLNMASRLSLPADAPVLIIARRYYSEEGRLVEMSLNTHPGGRFRYEMTLQRGHW
ncbi:MAG: GntR family transcriptional regulator [Alphaproteobacteria bacterium]|nr:GntR family transcriptional regulator [Alphaproteobacteria bacterium]MDX5369980.1 GntR family transcriptional regulator [Alphaproteobacteria bacterium]MDX5464558.1 GntR family transcriptional regulator [Alphaproteobacteria bacterium]